MKPDQPMHNHNHSAHVFCLATVVYNILVVVAEVVLQLVLTTHDIHDVVQFELLVQGVHILGTISLGILQWWIMHKMKQQTSLKFAGLSILMIVIHMIVLHLIPRLWGISLHEHHDGGELKEIIVLVSIVLFVTILFWKRETLLTKSGLKNKRMIDMRSLFAKKPL